MFLVSIRCQIDLCVVFTSTKQSLNILSGFCFIFIFFAFGYQYHNKSGDLGFDHIQKLLLFSFIVFSNSLTFAF